MPCPQCQGTDCRYSRRRPWERLVSKVVPRRPFRCLECRERFWASTQEEPTGRPGLRRHLRWILSLALVLIVTMLYIYNLPYRNGGGRHSGEGRNAEQTADLGGPPEDQDGGRRLRDIQLTQLKDGLRLELVSAAPLEHSGLRHFQVPDRMVLDLPGPWDPPLPSTEDLHHPLLDRVRLSERGIGLRLELLLRETDVEASLEETEDRLVITVRRSP